MPTADVLPNPFNSIRDQRRDIRDISADWTAGSGEHIFGEEASAPREYVRHFEPSSN